MNNAKFVVGFDTILFAMAFYSDADTPKMTHAKVAIYVILIAFHLWGLLS